MLAMGGSMTAPKIGWTDAMNRAADAATPQDRDAWVNYAREVRLVNFRPERET